MHCRLPEEDVILKELPPFKGARVRGAGGLGPPSYVPAFSTSLLLLISIILHPPFSSFPSFFSFSSSSFSFSSSSSSFTTFSSSHSSSSTSSSANSSFYSSSSFFLHHLLLLLLLYILPFSFSYFRSEFPCQLSAG